MQTVRPLVGGGIIRTGGPAGAVASPTTAMASPRPIKLPAPNKMTPKQVPVNLIALYSVVEHRSS